MAHHYLELSVTPSVAAAQQQYYGRSLAIPPSGTPDRLGDDERAFIKERDSFYIASVSEAGWPYLQHRGGPPGFLHVVDEHTLAFADVRGNRQMLTTGNVAINDRVALFLMNYPQRTRLKVMGRARVVPATERPDLVDALIVLPKTTAERVVLIDVVGFDWNCPKFITPRYTADEVETVTKPLRERIDELEAELRAALGAGLTSKADSSPLR